MSRADRLLNLADLLRGRDVTTVDALANELGVSRRTVLRDLASLRARGLPITGEPG
jgi:predicted DNA-binding transcriptional regulator YafY